MLKSGVSLAGDLRAKGKRERSVREQAGRGRSRETRLEQEETRPGAVGRRSDRRRRPRGSRLGQRLLRRPDQFRAAVAQLREQGRREGAGGGRSQSDHGRVRRLRGGAFRESADLRLAVGPEETLLGRGARTGGADVQGVLTRRFVSRSKPQPRERRRGKAGKLGGVESAPTRVHSRHRPEEKASPRDQRFMVIALGNVAVATTAIADAGSLLRAVNPRPTDLERAITRYETNGRIGCTVRSRSGDVFITYLRERAERCFFFFFLSVQDYFQVVRSTTDDADGASRVGEYKCWRLVHQMGRKEKGKKERKKERNSHKTDQPLNGSPIITPALGVWIIFPFS